MAETLGFRHRSRGSLIEIEIIMHYLKILTLCAALASGSATLLAETLPAGTESAIKVEVTNLDIQGDNLVVSLNLNTTGASEDSKLKTVYVPMVVNETDTACFDSFAVTGRKRWTHDKEDNTYSPLTFRGWGKERERGVALTPVPSSGNGFSVSGSGNSYTLNLSMPYYDWMGLSKLVIDCRIYGCSVCVRPYDIIEQQYIALADINFPAAEYVAEIIYTQPTNEMVKVRNVVSNAYIDFKVSQTNILPNYMNNPKELALIRASIDSIAADNDVDIKSITVHGMASPEGPFALNEKLAKGRTDALRDYIQKQHKLPKDFVNSVYEPVINWEGLADWLQNNSIENGQAILNIVNSNLADFDRNQKIKTDYPEQYNYLLKNVYPGLRVSVYTVNFEVRSYDTVEEIVDVMQTAPNKLSVYELFEAATSQGEEGELFEEAVNIAVRTYPEDATANLNAGVLAMKKGDYATAQKYLDKAGDSDEAKFAKAQLDALKGENEKALKAFKALENSSNPQIAAGAKAGAESVANIIKRGKK